MSSTDPYAEFSSIVAAPRRSPAPRALTASRAKAIWDKTTQQFEQSIASNPADRQRRQRAAFYADPRIKTLERAINTPQSSPDFQTRAPKVTTRQQEIQDIARANVQRSGTRDKVAATIMAAPLGVLAAAPFATSPGLAGATLSSALDSASFGLGDKLRAGLGSLSNGRSYDDNLALAREETRQRAEQSTTGNFLGAILGSVPSAISGGGLAKVAGLTSTRLPAVAARLTAGGALGGGAQAAGHDQDISDGALIGAIAAPALTGAGAALGWVGKKAFNLLGSRNISQILKSVTTATKSEIAARVAALQKQGIEPTLFEVLPLADRNRISQNIVGRSDPTLEGTQRLVTERLGNIGPEMASRVSTVAAPARRGAAQEMTDAMTAARGTPEMPGDNLVAARATRDPLTMAAQPGREARAIMAPHDEQTLFNSIDEIMPSHPELQGSGEVNIVADDPAVSAMIRRKAGLLSRKNAAEVSGGLTGRNVSDLLGELHDYAGGPHQDADVARAAIQHIEDQLSLNHPEFLDAQNRMMAAFAARSRMAEGATEGMNTRTRTEIRPTDINQPVRNAYGSDEGATGRALGQANALETGFAQAGPRKAISQAAALPNNLAAIEQNLGADAAGRIADTAASQTQGIRALAGLDRQSKTNPNTLGPDDLAGVVLGLSPSAMIRTKAMASQALIRHFSGVPEAKAQQLVELLFSTNAAQRQAAMNMLKSSSAGAAFLGDIAEGIGLGSVVQQQTAPSGEVAPTVSAPVPDAESDPYAEFSDVVGDGSGEPADETGEVPTDEASPYAEILQQIESTEDPAFLNLIDRQFHQESGNQHFGKNGRPKTSSAGAIGIAQVMPGTAPIAAKLAGLPYDAHAYRNDPAYNKTLGIAYMKAQMETFGGDPALALAAYNWGPGRVQNALEKWGDNWLDHAPAETQNYVLNILS